MNSLFCSEQEDSKLDRSTAVYHGRGKWNLIWVPKEGSRSLDKILSILQTRQISRREEMICLSSYVCPATCSVDIAFTSKSLFFVITPNPKQIVQNKSFNVRTWLSISSYLPGPVFKKCFKNIK